MKPFYLSDNTDFNGFNDKIREAAISFREQGFFIIDLGDDVSFADKIIQDCEKKYDAVAYEGSGSSRIQDAFSFSQNVEQLALNATILDYLTKIFGRTPIPFQTLNFNKGSEQATHSDTIHFNTYPYGFMCGVWVALENIDEKNGPLHYYPGSHKLPVFGMDQFGVHGSDSKDTYELYNTYETGVETLINELGLKKEIVNMKKGQCFVWSSNLLHGGEPIIDTTRTRHSQVTHYFFENCLYYTPLLSSPYKGEFFIRRPIDISTGQPISKALQRKYASSAGIDISKIRKKRWGFL